MRLGGVNRASTRRLLAGRCAWQFTRLARIKSYPHHRLALPPFPLHRSPSFPHLSITSVINLMSGNTLAANISLILPGGGGPSQVHENGRRQQTLGKGVFGQASARDTSPYPPGGGLDKRSPLPSPSDPDDVSDPGSGQGPEEAGCGSALP